MFGCFRLIYPFGRWTYCLFLVGAGLLLAMPAGSARAEIVEIEVTIKSVDARDRSITVVRSSKKSKQLDLEVSRKARITIDGESASLDDIEPGQTATISFETELEVVTQIEAAADGNGLPGNDDGDGEPGELKETGCQVIWSIDENGESTVVIGRPPASVRRASKSLIRHDDGTVEFQHDLNTPDTVLKTFLSRAENTRFDRNVRALVMAPKAGRGGQSPQANFAYSKVSQLPINLVWEFEGVGKLDQSLFSAQLQTSDDQTDFPALQIFSEDGFATAATVRPTWIVRRNRLGQPDSEPLLEEQFVELGEPREFSFQMPVPADGMRYVLGFGLQGQDSAIAMHRLSVRGRLTPTLGIALTDQGGVVLAERVLANGLGEAAGVRTGDQIVSINGIRPRSVEEAMEAMSGIRFGDEPEIFVRRGGRTLRITFVAE
ncbi:MAG: PDZ domain-containing protein [Pirellulales bacterium]